MTPSEVYATMVKEGYRVDYARVAIVRLDPFSSLDPSLELTLCRISLPDRRTGSPSRRSRRARPPSRFRSSRISRLGFQLSGGFSSSLVRANTVEEGSGSQEKARARKKKEQDVVAGVRPPVFRADPRPSSSSFLDGTWKDDPRNYLRLLDIECDQRRHPRIGRRIESGRRRGGQSLHQRCVSAPSSPSRSFSELLSFLIMLQESTRPSSVSFPFSRMERSRSGSQIEVRRFVPPHIFSF